MVKLYFDQWGGENRPKLHQKQKLLGSEWEKGIPVPLIPQDDFLPKPLPLPIFRIWAAELLPKGSI